MSITSSLNAAVMGLNANSARLSTISDNIANSETNGYKRVDVEFSNMVIEQRNSAYSAGGVRVDTFKDVSAVGSLISTGNATDIAVAGRGLIPVTTVQGVNQASSDRPLQLMPTGSFTADQNGNLRTQTGLFLMGWPADPDGTISNVSRNSGIDLEPVNIATSQFTASPTENINIGINLPAEATEAGSTTGAYSMSIEYFDNLGRAQTMRMEFTPNVPGVGASNSWDVQMFDNAGDPTVSLGDLDIVFNDTPTLGGRIDSVAATNGATYDATTGRFTINLAHGPVDIFIGRPGELEGMTQLAAPFSPTSVTKDGSPIGDLQSVEVDETGLLQAIYDTGFRRTLYQIPVGDVPNLDGLTALDGQAYSVSGDSGSLYLWDAGTGPVGAVSGFSLMESTTDIASELTDLIETQRAYSSSAKIVQTVDEMLQETTNLKR
ncbi:MAG: flagellar hook-basal body complex protein [Pseudomonadota bacterium]